MHSNCTKNPLNLEDVLIKNVVHGNQHVTVFIETNPSLQTCPSCGNHTTHIHDYRYQKVKDLPFQMKNTYLILK